MQKVITTYFVLIYSAFHFISCASSKITPKIQENYSGKISWNSTTKTLTFLTSGEINFKNQGDKSFIWQVPKVVQKIIIAENCTVNGAFHTYADIEIVGDNRKTSILYGTEIQSWSQKHKIKPYTLSSFESHKGKMTIQNLTSLNPRSYHVRGLGSQVHLKNADFIDNRGGVHNHSDGIAAGDGSTVDNCYFETADDVIKVYNDITVTNTTINMIKNAVPIQLGWGNYPNNAVGTFKNITIIGDSGRGSPYKSNPVIAGRSGAYTVTINIDGITIDNPKGSMVNLWDDKNDGKYEKTLKGTIKNLTIKNLKTYSTQLKGYDELVLYDAYEKEISKDF